MGEDQGESLGLIIPLFKIFLFASDFQVYVQKGNDRIYWKLVIRLFVLVLCLIWLVKVKAEFYGETYLKKNDTVFPYGIFPLHMLSTD